MKSEEEYIQSGELGWIRFLESKDVFFSSPLDLDFSMLKKFPDEFGVRTTALGMPEDSRIKAVLGKRFHDKDQ